MIADWDIQQGFDSLTNSGEDDYEFTRIKYETEKAWLVVIDKVDVWLPRSCCSMNRRKKIVTIPQWLAEEKELV